MGLDSCQEEEDGAEGERNVTPFEFGWLGGAQLHGRREFREGARPNVRGRMLRKETEEREKLCFPE